MKAKYRNIFLCIGLVAIVIMLITFPTPSREVWDQVTSHWFYIAAALGVWIPIYVVNALAWHVIINTDEARGKVSFWRTYKYTVTGYALNYVTPVGVLGGEPYRIMELTPYVGAAKASSSVILYAMMHIFSHFCFWAFSLIVFVIMYGNTINWSVGLLLLLMAAFCALGFYFFFKGYRDGLAMRALRFFSHLPWLGKKIAAFAERNVETINRVDSQIATLHAQHPAAFYWSLFLEFAARVFGCLEVLFILYILTPDVNFWDCILMQAFMSLFANLMFFIPMEMGTREGGFAMITKGLHMTNPLFGVLTGLITRIREVFWIAVGLLLMKVGNHKVESTENPVSETPTGDVSD